MNPLLTDSATVLVAGAGPSGLAAAAELALHGVDCLVVEPRAAVSHARPRAKTTNARTMEHLRRWGLAEAVRAAAPLKPHWSQRVTFCRSLLGPRVTDIPGAFGLTAERDDRFAEGGQQVAQPVVEQVLRQHLAGRTKVRMTLGWRVTGAVAGSDDVLVHLADAEGRTTAVRARHVLACDGPNSVLREAIGARLTGASDARSNFNVVFRAPGLDTPLGPAVQYWVVGGPVTGLIGRLDLDGTWWAILPGVGGEQTAESVTALVRGLIGGGEPGDASVDVSPDVPLEILATDTWTARMLVADRFQRGRIHLLGEAAHLNPPWGGHGYNTCVGDAVNIAWKIAAVEQGWGGEDLLASYEPERRGVVERTVASATANMRHLSGDLAVDPEAIRAAKWSEFHSLGLVLGYGYAGSPVVQPGAGAAAGAGDSAGTGAGAAAADTVEYVPDTEPGSRLPHHWLPDGSSLFDHLGLGLTLLSPVDVDAPALAGLRSTAWELGIPLRILPIPDGYAWPDRFLLVRPDQHIAWRAADPAEIDLRRVVGRRAVAQS